MDNCKACGNPLADCEEMSTTCEGCEQMAQQKLQFGQDIGAAQQGKVPWDVVRGKYPLRGEEVTGFERAATPISKVPGFQEATGLPAFFSQQKAKINPKVRNMIGQIKTQADMDEFLENVDKKIKDGSWTENDKRTVYEYFGLPY